MRECPTYGTGMTYLPVLVLGVCDELCRPLLPIHVEQKE